MARPAFVRNELGDQKMMGMALDHRMFEGCDGPQPQNPVVPEGKREIRLEYRAPEEHDAPGHSPRLPKVVGS